MLFNRRTLMSRTARIGISLSVIAAGKNKTGESNKSSRECVESRPVQPNYSWLCAGRAALALDSRITANEVL